MRASKNSNRNSTQTYSILMKTPVLSKILFLVITTCMILTVSVAYADSCIDCHRTETPGIVDQWETSKMSTVITSCSTCHGNDHTDENDYEAVSYPTPKTCGGCHSQKVDEFNEGKHALAWAAMEAMPRTASQPDEISDGKKGCGGCHQVGYAWEDGSNGKCDSCHTRHVFSKVEARKPESCQTCHMGFDHPNWEMWSTSKHGTIYMTEGDSWDWEYPTGGEWPNRSPVCQTCHMVEGDHEVITSWGFLGVRVPESDEEWWEDRVVILQGLGVLDRDGNPTDRLDLVAAAKVARLTEEEWQTYRDEMLEQCSKCHSENYARAQLDSGDAVLKASDELMAEAIEIMFELDDEGLLETQEGQEYAFAHGDLLTFYDAPTSVGQILHEMFLEFRMRTFQGAFHVNPDYMHWYGWAPMKKSLLEIREAADDLRSEALLEEKIASLESEIEGVEGVPGPAGPAGPAGSPGEPGEAGGSVLTPIGLGIALLALLIGVYTYTKIQT